MNILIEILVLYSGISLHNADNHYMPDQIQVV